MNMGQGLAMFGQSIGGAIKRHREKEEKKKEKEEMVDALKQFGIDDNLANMISGDKELFNNFATLKQIQAKEKELKIYQQKIDQMNAPDPAEEAERAERQKQGEFHLGILNDPKKSRKTYGVYSDIWSGGNSDDALLFHETFGKKPQPSSEVATPLKTFFNNGGDITKLRDGDPEHMRMFADAGGKFNEVKSFLEKDKEKDPFKPSVGTLKDPVTGKPVTYVHTSDNAVQIMPGQTDRTPAPSTLQKNSAFLKEAVNRGDVDLVNYIISKEVKTDPLGKAVYEDWMIKLLDEAEEKAKKNAR